MQDFANEKPVDNLSEAKAKKFRDSFRHVRLRSEGSSSYRMVHPASRKSNSYGGKLSQRSGEKKLARRV